VGKLLNKKKDGQMVPSGILAITFFPKQLSAVGVLTV